MPAAVVVESIDMNPRLSHDKIRISESEAPGRRLLLRMIDVQRMLANVNTSLLTGVSLGRDDWEELRVGCVTLGEVFENEVVFAWDDEDTSSVQSLSQSHNSLPSPLRRHRPGNEPGKNPTLHSSMPPKSRVTSTTNAGPKRRSVTFKETENMQPKDQDEFVGSVLNKPLQTIMSIGSPIVPQNDRILLGGPLSSAPDEIHEENDAMVNGSGPHGEQQQNVNGTNGNLAKHRVRANPNASLPGELPMEAVPLGVFEKGTTLPMHVSGIDSNENNRREPPKGLQMWQWIKFRWDNFKRGKCWRNDPAFRTVPIRDLTEGRGPCQHLGTVIQIYKRWRHDIIFDHFYSVYIQLKLI